MWHERHDKSKCNLRLKSKYISKANTFEDKHIFRVRTDVADGVSAKEKELLCIVGCRILQ